MKFFRRAFFIFLIFILVFSPFSFSSWNMEISDVKGAKRIAITEDTFWKKDDNIIIKDWITINGGATLTIEKGSVITFDSSDGYIPTLTVENGRIVAEGTLEEKIIFKTTEAEYEWDEDELGYQVALADMGNNGTSFFRYVEFQNGGYYPHLAKNKLPLIRNMVVASGGQPALTIYGGKSHLENVSFLESNFISAAGFIYEDLENPQENLLEIINSNFEESGDRIAFSGKTICEDSEGTHPCPEKIILKNNWYGSSAGAREAPKYDVGGEKIVGDYKLDGFRKNNLIIDPAIIIPGITGSWEVQGEWQMDPILHTYDNLIELLKESGFEENINLFAFPYEWRNSNVLTADLLKDKVAQIRSLTRASKVDIVAHSMGGLVAREYIQGEKYNQDIDQLITLGTPHNGSPEAYLKWEAGEGFFDKLGMVVKLYFQMESLHAGYIDLTKYIQNKILSLKELLPDYDYLENASSGKMKNYPDGYPQNTFLENLNKENALEKLKEVDFTNIVGKNGKDGTIKEFRIEASAVSGKWEHGMPENFYDQSTDQGVEYGEGDETVPYSSATGIPYDKIIELDSSHGDLPTKSQCQVLKELTAKEDCAYITTWKRIKNILTFRLFSPIDIQIISPSGKKIGKDFETGDTFNEIENAFYSGYGTENEFVTIPDPEDGDYQILTQGTGSGEYTIKADQIKEYDDGTSASRNILDRTGTTEMGGLESFHLDFEDTDFKDGSETTLIATGSSTENLKNNSSSDKKTSEKHSSSISDQENSIFSDPSQNSLFAGFSNPLQKENYPSQTKSAESSEVRGISDEKKTNWFLNIFFISVAIIFFLATLKLAKFFLRKNNI